MYTKKHIQGFYPIPVFTIHFHPHLGINSVDKKIQFKVDRLVTVKHEKKRTRKGKKIRLHPYRTYLGPATAPHQHCK